MNRILQVLLLFSITFLSVTGQDPAGNPPLPADTTQPTSIRDSLPASGEPGNPPLPADTIPPSALRDTLPAPDEIRYLPYDTLPSPEEMPSPEDSRYLPYDTLPSPVFDTIHPDLSRSERLGRRGRINADTLKTRDLDPDHSPSRAIMYALVLPGLGQAYNGKYYKIPFVYAAMGGAGYAINFNTQKYREASRIYAEEQNDFNERVLGAWRRYMELSYFSMIAIYALQVIDAYVDAQLYYWDVNENLSMRVTPSVRPIMVPSGMAQPVYGLTCSIDFKGRK
jgi:hypothetical protein